MLEVNMEKSLIIMISEILVLLVSLRQISAWVNRQMYEEYFNQYD